MESRKLEMVGLHFRITWKRISAGQIIASNSLKEVGNVAIVWPTIRTLANHFTDSCFSVEECRKLIRISAFSLLDPNVRLKEKR